MVSTTIIHFNIKSIALKRSLFSLFHFHSCSFHLINCTHSLFVPVNLKGKKKRDEKQKKSHIYNTQCITHTYIQCASSVNIRKWTFIHLTADKVTQLLCVNFGPVMAASLKNDNNKFMSPTNNLKLQREFSVNIKALQTHNLSKKKKTEKERD